MKNYWFVVTKWNDDSGQERSRVEHWADASEFRFDDLLADADAAKLEVLKGIYTVDVPNGKPRDRLRYIFENNVNALILSVISHLVPNPTDGRWISLSPVKANSKPDDEDMIAVEDKYGVRVWKLKSPFEPKTE